MDYQADPGWQYLRMPIEEQLKAQAAIKLDPKTSVWVPDADEGFIIGTIKSEENGVVTVSTANGEKNLKKDETQEINPPKYEKSEDMSTLTFLNEASVLHNLRSRYAAMMIYTYSGLFCVVINPYKRLPIYTESIVRSFSGKRRNEMPPHLFAVSDEGYRNMMSNKENQSMLITGESGAGKTENTKKVIAYFAIVGSSQQKKDGEKKIGLEEQIVQTNPVLEAFGNAKTVRNNNSSRFGKFIRIHFNTNGKLAGCDIEHYLLEKSRVIKQAPGERSYHIFYQIMSGQLKGLKESLNLEEDIRKYSFVSQAEVSIADVDDADEMRITDEAFDVMNFSQTEKDDLYKLTAAIMHLGEMKFKQKPREEQAEPEETENAELTCKLFGVAADSFLTAICKPRVKVGTEWVNKGQNLEQVNWSVGALAKAIYARMFTWLIKRCNKTLDAHDLSRDFFIGVLDIAGFEIFDVNSFEQLWINFVNEKLQQFFNHHMFVLEQEEYQREGIQWEFIDFGLDLQACIELIEKPLGVISMLDEECIVPKATDMTFASKLNDQHIGKHPNFQKPRPPKGKQGDAHFALVHYAGTVRYNAKMWLEKNKDPLNDTAVSVLKSTENNQLLRDIWEDYRTQEDDAKDAELGRSKQAPGKKKGKSGSMMTVSMMYRESLAKLMAMLKTTHPHFIRCIIPNEQKKSGLIEAGLVLNQLTCNGVLEGIRICRKGFPNRQLYPEFKYRYAILAAEEASNKDPREAGDKMMQKLVTAGKIGTEDYRIGQTKIFFKAGILARMEELRDEALSIIITKFQCACKAYLALCDYKRRLDQGNSYQIIQDNIRMWCTLRSWPWFSTYARVKPLIQGLKKTDEFEALEKKCVELEESLNSESAAKVAAQGQLKAAEAERLQLAAELEKEVVAKKSLETEVIDLKGTANDLEEANGSLKNAKNKLSGENQKLQGNISDMEISLKKHESEKEGRERTILSLQDEMTQQDSLIAKLNQDKKMQEEVNRQLSDNLLAESNRNERLEGTRNKLEGAIDELEQSLQLEKKAKMDSDRLRKKLESELRMAVEQLQELKSQKLDLENYVKKKDAEVSALKGQAEDDQTLVSKFQITIRELQARIEQLEQELEQEIRGRRRAEKLKQDLQEESDLTAQRLEEANGALSAQIHLNKTRKAELARVYHEMEVKSMDHETHVNEMTNLHFGTLRHLQDLAQKAATLESEAGNILHQVQNPPVRRLPISRSVIMEPAFGRDHGLDSEDIDDLEEERDPPRGLASRQSTRSLMSNKSWVGSEKSYQPPRSHSRSTYRPPKKVLSEEEDDDVVPAPRSVLPSLSVSKTTGGGLASRAGLLTSSSGFDFEERCKMIALSLESGLSGIDTDMLGQKKRPSKRMQRMQLPVEYDSEDDDI